MLKQHSGEPYWGLEGGERFYFARVRFTPFVGYLVGINRFDDIRGTDAKRQELVGG
jgi:hypothetical protein